MSDEFTLHLNFHSAMHEIYVGLHQLSTFLSPRISHTVCHYTRGSFYFSYWQKWHINHIHLYIEILRASQINITPIPLYIQKELTGKLSLISEGAAATNKIKLLSSCLNLRSGCATNSTYKTTYIRNYKKIHSVCSYNETAFILCHLLQ